VVRLILLLVLLSLLPGCGEEAPALRKGAPTPAFSLALLDGGSLRFPEDLRGKPVIIRFWADWCPFCKTEMRDIEPLFRANHERGLVILAINVRQDRARAAAFIKELGISYPVLLDQDGAVARAYGVSGLPTTLILDREGRLQGRIIGPSTTELLMQVFGEVR
jgi:cytochrome c biogenesis protein CcmG, thiol:disulfide interchange protein DsbE